MPLERRTGE